MDWVQFVVFVLGNMIFTLTLWLWNRSESRRDTRRILDLIEAINKEMKDFHGRLCTIEERKKNSK